MKIKTKILCTLLAMSILVMLNGVLAINRQRASVTTAATREAENVALVLSLLLTSTSSQSDTSAQKIVTQLHESQGRDMVLMNSQKKILADAVPSEVGTIYSDDQHNEVDSAIKDGDVRTFIEISRDYPAGIRQIVVPVKSNSGQMLGAVVMEYTPLYNDLMNQTKATIRQVVGMAIVCALAAMVIAIYIGRSIVRPIERLRDVTIAFAAGKMDLQMPPPRADELGELAAAFDNMVKKRQQAEYSLSQARDQLEVRVTERTQELAKSNEALRIENAERKRAEQKLNVEYAVNRILADSPSWEHAIEKVMQTIGGIFCWKAGAFWLADHRTGLLRCGEVWTSPELQGAEFNTSSRQLTFQRGSGLPGRVWASGQPIWICDVQTDDNFKRVAAAKQAGLHGALAFPIMVGNGVGGIIEFYNCESHDLDDDLLQSFSNVGNQLGQFFERKRVENHLFQSQKMETVGKLAGGIAHEFNSILTAIIGQSELLSNDLGPESPLINNATEIRRAAERAASLTRQLLAYGRKQILRPEILELNTIITGMENVLQHLVGRDVEARFNPAADLKSVKADAGQIEQVVVNIVMNAADAMPNGGRLTLETVNVTLDSDYVSRFPEIIAGDYVMLAISDTGAGMSDEVKARVFEPFFTTKGIGKGTGLGLATCHGIVKQSGGHIAVYSELGRGTTFKIYLPQIESTVKALPQSKAPSHLPRGIETILLVEDDPSLRVMAATLLKQLGYTVLAATNGVEAMNLVHQQGTGHIDLLFTDVVMPQMSGKELADRLCALHPQIKVLFTSAYTESTIVHQGVLNEGVTLLQKPFTPSALANKIRAMLDGKNK